MLTAGDLLLSGARNVIAEKIMAVPAMSGEDTRAAMVATTGAAVTMDAATSAWMRFPPSSMTSLADASHNSPSQKAPAIPTRPSV